jgi:hypothetical protein
VWRVACGVWRVACGVWRVACTRVSGCSGIGGCGKLCAHCDHVVRSTRLWDLGRKSLLPMSRCRSLRRSRHVRSATFTMGCAGCDPWRMVVCCSEACGCFRSPKSRTATAVTRRFRRDRSMLRCARVRICARSCACSCACACTLVAIPFASHQRGAVVVRYNYRRCCMPRYQRSYRSEMSERVLRGPTTRFAHCRSGTAALH